MASTLIHIIIFLNIFLTIKCEYYSLDGTNNNNEHPEWGTGGQPYRRMPNEHNHLSYSDKSHQIDESGPNTRIISNAMGQIPKKQSKYDSYAPLSGIAWAFSKTISQEMCKTDIKKTEDSFSPIKVPPCDWFLDYQCNNNTIIPFFRAGYTNTIKPNTLNQTYRTPINKATAFIDLHYLYGTTQQQHHDDIRVGQDGLIKTDAFATHTADELVNMLLNLDDEQKLFTFYDKNVNNIQRSTAGIHAGIAGYSNTKCPIVAGEGSTAFTLISHLYRLEHNRIARELKQKYGWRNDEYLFQEARARLIATVQHIVYTEYLPLFLAYPIINEVIEKGPNGFDVSLDPTVSTWFCGVAHRYAHPATPQSLVFGGYHDINDNNKVVYGGYADEQISTIPIRDALKYPCLGIDQIKNYHDPLNDVYVESMLAGLMLEPERLIGPEIIEDLRSYLKHGLTPYASEFINNSLGINITEYTDLFAIDIYRTRDFGLPKYNDARELFNLSRVEKWSDLTGNAWYLEILPLLYGADGIDNLDVYVGALVERLEADNIETSTGSGHVGQLMAAILRDQYKRAAMGDRLFYAFNETLKNYTKDMTLSRLIELNTNLKNLSTDIFTADAKNYQHYVTENERNGKRAILLRGRLEIEWEINEDANYIELVFTLNGCGDGCNIGWIGIGFGVGQYMKGKDIIKMNFDRLNDTHPFNVIDSHSPPNQWLPVPDKINNVEMLNGSFDGEEVMVSIRRPLVSISDINNEDYPIYLNQEQDIIVAFSTHSFDKHNTNDRTPGRINWSSGHLYEVQINIVDNVRFNHGILMILLFGICYPISAFCARYLKHFTWSRDKHKISAKLGLTTALTSAYMAMSTVQDRAATTHGKLGLCCIILLMLQVCIGYMIDYWLRNKTRGFIYQKVHYFHLFIAFCILSIAPITMWAGWNELALYHSPILQEPYIWYIFIIFVIIIGELYIHIWPRFASKGAMNQSQIHNYHIYTWSEVSQNVSSGASWIIIDDHIYDVTEWQHSHPGGRQILLHYVGTDCTDFFNGTSDVGYAHGNIKHEHSDYAKKQLIQMIVGQISKTSTKPKDDHDDGMLLFDVAGDNMHRILSADSNNNYDSNLSISAINKREDHALRLKIITLINKQRLNKVKHTINSRKVVLFEFDYNVQEHGIKFDGDYILLHHVDKNTVTRAYTPINPEFVLLNGCAFYKSPIQDKSDANSSKFNVLHQQNRLFLIIKLYKKGRMSRILSSLKIGHTIRISGPFRREKIFPSIRRMESDIELDYGQHCWRRIVLICGGTGITPMFNALYTHLKNGNEECKVNLIWCNKTLNDVFYEDILKWCKMMYFNRFWVDLKFDIAIISETLKDTKERLKWARLHAQQWHKLEIVQMIRYFFKNGIPLNCDLDSIKLKQLSEEHTMKKLNRQISVNNIRRKFKGQKNDETNHRYSSISVISRDDQFGDDDDNDSDEKHSQYIQVRTNSEYNKTEPIELQSIDSYYVKLTSLHQHDRIILSGPKPFVEKIRNAIEGAPDLKQLRIDKQLIALD